MKWVRVTEFRPDPEARWPPGGTWEPVDVWRATGDHAVYTAAFLRLSEHGVPRWSLTWQTAPNGAVVKLPETPDSIERCKSHAYVVDWRPSHLSGAKRSRRV